MIWLLGWKNEVRANSVHAVPPGCHHRSTKLRAPIHRIDQWYASEAAQRSSLHEWVDTWCTGLKMFYSEHGYPGVISALIILSNNWSWLSYECILAAFTWWLPDIPESLYNIPMCLRLVNIEPKWSYSSLRRAQYIYRHELDEDRPANIHF